MDLKELKAGDKVWVKCPSDAEKWQEETITNVLRGVDSGSKLKYTRIFTDRTTKSFVSNTDVYNGYHWPLLITMTYNNRGTIEAHSEANSNFSLVIRFDDPFDEENQLIPTLIDIIRQAEMFDLRSEESLPEHAIVVGMGNNRWECRGFYYMKKTDHDNRKLSYGGYTFIRKDGNPGGWWTMNLNYAGFRKEYFFIVPDEVSGYKLADLLNLIGNDWLDTERAVLEREKKIAELNREIDMIKSTEEHLKSKINETKK